MSLSDATIRCVKSKNQEFKLFDEGGLYLLIKPSGSKLWRFKYRIHGKDRALALGSYPATSLKAARKARDEAKELLEKGGDPSTEKKRQAVVASIAAASTFNIVAEEYVQKLRDDGMAPTTEKKTLWLLKQFADNLGPRPISDIEPFEVLHVLRKVEKKGNFETAHRLRSFAGRVFKYAIWTSRAKSDPTAMLAGALRTPKVTNHAAIVEAKPLGGLLRAIDGFEGYKPIGYALKLSPHVFVRPSELRRAEWTEFNLEEAYWRIPAKRMKMGREHWVPLSRQSVSLLRELNEITGNHAYLFPSIRTWQRPMSENAVNVALRRLGYGSDEMTGHGFRSTASTLLNESGRWQPDAIEVALAHKDRNKVRGTYNRGRYWDERVEMAQWWSDYLDDLKTSECGNVRRVA
ncbi:integrase arm-type DNA-binding domain-containing protein [Asticcacaulis sp.]|uniref:tyrosine-type recombinase/integrase n=1 Tax=Asticcacaulis sp. TaxID=1872648 RepID=UPI00260ACC1C|nr:integrase arm-type DNA-binding domain-containing protein [Asticcacaulis sp.]